MADRESPEARRLDRQAQLSETEDGRAQLALEMAAAAAMAAGSETVIASAGATEKRSKRESPEPIRSLEESMADDRRRHEATVDQEEFVQNEVAKRMAANQIEVERLNAAKLQEAENRIKIELQAAMLQKYEAQRAADREKDADVAGENMANMLRAVPAIKEELEKDRVAKQAAYNREKLESQRRYREQTQATSSNLGCRDENGDFITHGDSRDVPVRTKKEDPLQKDDPWTKGQNELPTTLEREREKRRKLEDEMERLENKFKDLAARTARNEHTLAKTVSALLNEPEKTDQLVVMCVKKKACKMGEMYGPRGATKDKFETDMLAVPGAFQVCTAGPIWCIKVSCGSRMQAVLDSAKHWEATNLRNSLSIFKGKSQLTQMKESPCRLTYSALMDFRQVGKGEGKSQGYKTNWPDMDGKWGITHDERQIVRGIICQRTMTATVVVDKQSFEDEQRGKDFIDVIRRREMQDRLGCLFPIEATLSDLVGEDYGRNTKGSGKGR